MRVAPIFTDHAVLQCDLPIPVWGSADPGRAVIVSMAGVSVGIRAGADGSWLVRLPPLPAGGPHELLIVSGDDVVRLRDILVGEVWVCAGQSNMEWPLGNTSGRMDPCDEGWSQIRLLTMRNRAGPDGSGAIAGSWVVADAGALNRFSAVGGWFGRDIHRTVGVPVGLICNAWGGTRLQAWMSREALMREPQGLVEVRHYESHAYDPSPAVGGIGCLAEGWEPRAPPLDAGNRGLAEGWARADCDDATWPRMRLPAHWQDHGHPGTGVFWFRRAVDIPEGWAGSDLELSLGAIDKHDETYVNGEQVGGLGWDGGGSAWRTPRIYRIPGRLVHPGRMVIAVRVRSHAYHGGCTGPAEAMRLHPPFAPGTAIGLSGTWAYRIEQDWGVQPQPAAAWAPGNPNTPYALFDSRIRPLIPFAIRGVLWYQGENNIGEADVYRRLLPAMIEDWRRAWGEGDFPFILVQLANYRKPGGHPAASDWAELRDAQLAAIHAVPNAGMAVAIDAGDAEDIHPDDKRTVGLRLAQWAIANVYGLGGTPSGPIFSGMTIETGGRVRCRFTHAHGLRTRDGAAPSHVDIAGNDRRFLRAETLIDGGALIAWHPDVPRPAAVRYAWYDNPAGCNLTNGDGLPAAPFRSDAWRC